MHHELTARSREGIMAKDARDIFTSMPTAGDIGRPAISTGIPAPLTGVLTVATNEFPFEQEDVVVAARDALYLRARQHTVGQPARA